MKKRFIAAAVPVLVAGSLAAAAPSMSQAAAGNDGPQTAPRINAKAAAAEIVPCVGGKQKKALTGGHANWMSSTSATVVPGTELSFRGPESGKDTVFVNFTAVHTYVNNSEDNGRVRVQIDGVDLKPGNAAAEYTYSANNYVGSFAGQYCVKVGPGWHDLRVVLESADWDGDSSDTAWLYNPMVHVEVAD
jgi:hypothetical protein